ncbi:1-aminocyclopropane-1-carboxylate deaminase/D-cysteine desulfhydrase [Fulvivirga sedimenti]|uniref:Pyridoxal-phosphate dependent enzyme n=1 Tax=Fulvivirga sedimenti TaxID=2879465 RepID=A0A9X1HVF7_9BACT|nr:pyridoxal-phosphate dependent enzyme [Fulvivirga sedimenti]MCA6078675.1 pyridoxal-phosphate dependent enzyme [Fulvivirga sedimenti]
MNVITRFQESFLQRISEPLLGDREISLWIRREDLIHPEISGNKWWKLSGNLQEILDKSSSPTLLTFGGAYSNHLYATASACAELGIPCIGIVRGEIPEPRNATLTFASDKGMELVSVSRSEYRNNAQISEKYQRIIPNLYVVPEGGTNEAAVLSCTAIVDDRMKEMNYVCVPAGTGGTMAGIIGGMENHGVVLGFSALKGDFLSEEVNGLLKKAFPERDLKHWRMITDYHHGGYARISDELIAFIQSFYGAHGILLDPVYTGKMMFGIYDMIRRDLFPAGSSICAIHTGGLQGWNGIRERYGIDPTSF